MSALRLVRWCEPAEWPRLTGSGWQKPEPEAELGPESEPGERTSPTQLLSPAGGGTGHSLICSVTSDTRLQPPWHHNTRPGPCQLGLPGPQALWRQGQAPQDQGPYRWPSESRNPYHHQLLGRIQRLVWYWVSRCVSALPPHSAPDWLWPCISAEDSQRKHLQGSTAWCHQHLGRANVIFTQICHPVTILSITFGSINYESWEDYNYVCPSTAVKYIFIHFQGHFPTKPSQCSDIRVRTSLQYEGGLHWGLKTWYSPYNKWWQPLRCD